MTGWLIGGAGVMPPVTPHVPHVDVECVALSAGCPHSDVPATVSLPC